MIKTPGPEGAVQGAAPKRGKSAGEKKTVEPISPTPEAVVVDTSLWGKGTVDLAILSGMAGRLGKSDIELWVPLQVLLEWSRHAADDADALAPAWGRLRRAGQVEGPVPVSNDIQTVVDTIKAKIEAIPNVTILPMHGDSAIAGIKDQILGTGPGEVRKETVRTGAVDSSWVRDALAHAGGDPTKIVFLTDNAKDVYATTKDMGLDAATVNISTEHHLYASLFTVNQADETVTRLVADHLLGLVPVPDPDYHSPPFESWIQISDFDLSASAFDPPYSFEVDYVELDPYATIVGIRNVQVVDTFADDKVGVYESTVEFDVVLHANLTVFGYALDNDGAVQTSTSGIFNAVVTAPFVADVGDLHVVTMTSAGPAKVASAEARASDPYEAREWLTFELISYAGITGDVDELIGEAATLEGFGGRKVEMSAVGDVYDEWDLHFVLVSDDDETEVHLVCRYDPSARVWAGKDSFDAYPPYYVSTQGREYAPEPYSAIAVIWRWLVGH